MQSQVEPNLSYFIAKARSIDGRSFQKKIKVAILSSFTINGLEEALRVKCAESDITCATYLCGYGQYNQDILDQSSKLYEFSPDITFMIIDTRSVLSTLFYTPYTIPANDRRTYIDKRVADFVNLVKTFKNRTGSKLVLTNCSIPTYSPYGICEVRTEYGLKEMVYDFNARLSDAFRSDPQVFLFDFNSFVAKYGEINVLDYRQFLVGDIKVSLSYIPHLAEELMGYVKANLGVNRKCIVLDLDNTLWGGIIGEDGFDRIDLSLKPPGMAFMEFQRVLLALYQRGVILAINSRNNEDEALRAIRDHPFMVLREEHFATMKINWSDKISNMKEIAQELNIGLDSIVYFDDDPINRELMSKAIPQIKTIDLPDDPSLYASTLMQINDFNTLVMTNEDRKRGEMYREEHKRTELKRSSSNLEDFLKQLEIRVTMKKANNFTIPRIAQLTLKTNQFNLTTRRYQEEDVETLAQDHTKLIGCAQTQDKFGDNGITGVYIVNKNHVNKEWFIDTFLLSCRVMGRGIEDAMMGYILSKAKEEGVIKVKAEFIPTKKNKPCEQLLPNFGFKKEGEQWVYTYNVPIKQTNHVELNED
ncbi:MAG: HAD-IIIC family phosphatase [Nitrososphaeraceae archaeon]